MVDITEISAIVAAAGVLVGVVFTVLELRHIRKQRQTELLIRLNPWLGVSGSELQQALRRTLNLEFTDAEDFVKRYGSIFLVKPEQDSFFAVLNYFDGLGMLVRKGLVDADLVYEVWTEGIANFWERVKPLVERTRKDIGYPFWISAEYLYNELKKREQQLAPRTA